MQSGELFKPNHSPVSYNDLLFRIIASIVGAHIVVVYGDPRSTLEILLLKAYYPAMLGSFIIAFILFSLIRWVIKLLDKYFDWKKKLIERIGMQVLTGMVLPAIAAFILAWAYFQIRGGINILKISYVRYDYQFIVGLLFMINLYYVAYFFFVRWEQAETALLVRPKATETAIAHDTTYTVSKGSQNLILQISQIAYFFREREVNQLRTFEGEDFFIEDTLDEIDRRLPKEHFFRANRQLIVNRKACSGYNLMTYGKLGLQLKPLLYGEWVVSQKRAVPFKKWLDQ